MSSVRSTRRKPFVDEKYSILEQMKLINRLGRTSLIPSLHRKSRQRDRRYARDVVNQTVFEWLHISQKPIKKKRRFRKQTISPLNKRHSANRQTHCTSTSPISSARRSTTSTTASKLSVRGKTENHHQLYPSSFPTRITTKHVTLQRNSLHNDRRSLVYISQTPTLSSVIEDKQYSCEIMMMYQPDATIPIDLHKAKRDEITIFQESSNGYNSVVFKGFLKAGDTFTFKSQRSVNDRFQLIICINDLVYSYLSSCCELQYQYGFQIGGENGLFSIQNIEGAKSCRKCGEDTEVSSKSHSTNKRMSVSSSSRTSSRLKLPVINTNQPPSEIKSKSTSITKSNASENGNQSRINTARNIEASTNKFPRVSITPQSTVSLPVDNRSSPLLPSTNVKSSGQKSNSRQLLSESIISKTSENVPVTTGVSLSPIAASEKTTVNVNELTASSSQIQITNDDTTLTQSLMTLLQLSMTQLDPPRSIPPRITGDVENFTLAWIGPTNEGDIILLRHAVNFVHVFYNIDALNTFITECIHTKVIILLSTDKARSILSQVYKLACVYSIYLLSTDECEKFIWTKEYHEIDGVYHTIGSLRDHLLKTLPQVSSTLIPIVITNDSTTNDIPFTYCQLLKETMLCDDDESDLKKDMLEFCCLHYENNPNEMNNIDKFEQEFVPEKVIWWYTRNTFLTKVLNRGMRTQEIDLLYKMRYIMQCLYTQIKSIAMNERTTVYVVLDIPLDNAKKLQENINGLLLFGAYLPAMLEQPQSVHLNKDNEQISVMFSINLGPGRGAKVKDLCSSDLNIDVLVNVDAIFRIYSIKKENDRQWNVNLESVSHADDHFKQLAEPLRSEIEAPVVLLQLSKLLLATDHYAECDYLAELLFTDESLRGDSTLLASLAAVHHLLGNMDDEKGNYKAACIQFFKSLRAFQSFLPSDHPLMSASYNNIGSMFFKDNEYNEAITFHQKALDCQLKSATPDTDAIATYSNNIGAVYYEQGKYLEALKHLQRAATILEKLSHAEQILNLCLIYQKIATIYWRMDKAKEALEYYKKTLDIQLVSLPPTAHQISVTYFNLSTAYARVGQMDDAVMSAEKSVEQLLKIFPPDHSEVKENQAQLEIVRQKQWLQQVLAT